MIYKLRDVEESHEALFLAENVKNKKFLRFESTYAYTCGRLRGERRKKVTDEKIKKKV